MKKYIIITYDIHPIGGTQKYTSAKAEYLQRNNWDVYVMFEGEKGGRCEIRSLEKYVNHAVFGLETQPEYLSKHIKESIIKKMVSIIGDTCDETIIESQAGIFALWGELLAKELNAKHICFTCNEVFREPYKENLRFFDFKHKRRELAGIHDDSLVDLFDGYKTVQNTERYVLHAAPEEQVQTVFNEKIESIVKLDWNICYIGRFGKGYINNILHDVAIFASKHLDKNIQFILVGDAIEKEKYIKNLLKNIKNLVITLTGNLVPIPRALYSKIDVVIAGSGCAFCSAYEGVPVIIADAGNGLANGVFGYDTFNTLYATASNGQTSFVEALENVLVDKLYVNREIRLPERVSAEQYYKEYFQFVYDSEQKQEYYTDFYKPNIIVTIKISVKYYLNVYCPWLINIKRRIFK